MTRFLPLLFLLLTFSLIGQVNQKRVEVYTGPIVQVQDTSKQKKDKVHKALGDTLFYEDFSDSTLSGWTAYSLNVTTFNWIWSNSAPGGQYSFNMPPLSSPTSSNGFISLPADLYNTPMGNGATMDAWIVSNAIPITPSPSVDLSFRQFLRYCCFAQNPIEVQVSNDSINWTALDAKNGRRANATGPNGEKLTFHAIPALANQSTAYIRFRMTGNSHYFWMVDDVTLTEGYTNALRLEEAIFDPFPDNDQRIHYAEAPNYCNYAIYGFAKNEGAYTQRNVRLEADIYMDSTIGGGPGVGFIGKYYSDTNTVPTGGIKDIGLYFSSLNSGHYRALVKITSDSLNQSAFSRDTLIFKLTLDTTITRDYGRFSSTIGPSDYHNPRDGDIYGILMDLDSGLSLPIYSVSAYISSDPNNVGVALSPKIWLYQADTLTTPHVGFSPFSLVIQPNMLGSWITMPIFPPIVMAPSSFVVGVEQTAGAIHNKGFSLGRDVFAEQRARSPSCFVYLNDSLNPSWYSTTALAGIRLNINSLALGPCNFVGLDESDNQEGSLSIYPNPSEGIFTIVGGQVGDLVEVRDFNGRMVHSEFVQSDQHSLDLNFLQNGLYFIHIKGKQESVEKVIINRH